MLRCTCVALALTACGVDVHTSPQPTSDPTAPDAGVDAAAIDAPPGTLAACEEARLHSDLAWIQKSVFDVSCLTGCHGALTPAAGLSLRAGEAYGSLVNVTSTQFPDWKRVVPGSPASSMLMVQLGGEPGPALEGLMPWGQPALCPEKIDAIRRWIAQGALPQ